MRSGIVHRNRETIDRRDPLRLELLAAELELWEMSVDANRLSAALVDMPPEEAMAAIGQLRSQLDKVEALLR
jgi:hypothetical protein